MTIERRTQYIRALKNRIDFLRLAFPDHPWASGLSGELSELLKDIQQEQSIDKQMEAFEQITKAAREIQYYYIDRLKPVPKYNEGTSSAKTEKASTNALTAVIKHLRRNWKKHLTPGENAPTVPVHYIDALEDLLYDLEGRPRNEKKKESPEGAFVRGPHGEERAETHIKGKGDAQSFVIREFSVGGDRTKYGGSPVKGKRVEPNTGEAWLKEKVKNAKPWILLDHSVKMPYFGTDPARPGADRVAMVNMYGNKVIPTDSEYNPFLKGFDIGKVDYEDAELNRKRLTGTWKVRSFVSIENDRKELQLMEDALPNVSAAVISEINSESLKVHLKYENALKVGIRALEARIAEKTAPMVFMQRIERRIGPRIVNSIWKEDCAKCEDSVLRKALTHYLGRELGTLDYLEFCIERKADSNSYQVKERDKPVGTMELSTASCSLFTARFTMTKIDTNDKK